MVTGWVSGMREKKDQMSKITIRVASHHACITLTQENSCEGLNLSGFYFSICTLGMPPHRTCSEEKELLQDSRERTSSLNVSSAPEGEVPHSTCPTTKAPFST